MINLTINGEDRRFETAPTVSQVIAELGLTQRRIAVERNGEIVPRSRFDTTRLAAGDRVEIVVAVGGG
ncbi:MAG: sulfur carrier protein ThiS [Betaproteobacteria bacterium]|nr:sulfur carrier protein ThiS [Betaproteobacteria bacterium]MDE2621775.1 sulfur carrier protein ThiS [Betaproteobacteria bacterium]